MCNVQGHKIEDNKPVEKKITPEELRQKRLAFYDKKIDL
jgi:hypothetical protein